MEECALTLARALGYRSAGTVEFLFDVESGRFYFLEMNARLQVEHPVTEMITGHDLVLHQIRVAEGQRLGLPARIARNGHAIECRINAEDWEQDFRPSPGRITGARFAVGPGLRLESHVTDGTPVPPYYDSMIAKLVAWGKTREAASERIAAALSLTAIEGVASTLGLHRRILADPEFRSGGVDTAFLARRLAAWRAGGPA
jgi:acetyl-CoA carboxylase biotin carboxylase subunit